jgi:ferric-dicitrate binding protein FerR (iron transport regulator)
MKPRLNLKLFAKFFWGIASDEEKERIYDSEESHQMLKEQWNKSNTGLLNPDEKEKMFSRIENRKTSKVKRLYNRAWRVAAIVILLIAIGGLYQIFFQPFTGTQITYIEKTNPAGQRSQVVLPDNSVVWLNAQSTITYPETFEDQENRKVKLSGEAYFDVAHNQSKPFLVRTDHFKVRVLGTSFNVKAYAQDDQFMTTLVSGKVELTDRQRDKAQLKPGEMCVYNKNNQSFEIKKGVDTKKITSWKEGKIIFDDVPFSVMAKELERWYGKEIEIAKELRGKHSYTMTVTDEKLNEVCNLIKESSPVTYKIQDNKIIFSSSK